MRDWNTRIVPRILTASPFVSYLWGIETGQWQSDRSTVSQPFVSYLWGIETLFGSHIFLNCHWVCILPMRDWNQGQPKFLDFVGPFVSYLWGIETTFLVPWLEHHKSCLYLTYEGLKPTTTTENNISTLKVCILPMRDWNALSPRCNQYGKCRLYLTYEGLKQSSRWQKMTWILSLYLTYEGLKLIFFWSGNRITIGLYLTYEGLKRIGFPLSKTYYYRLYLTYEGLKPILSGK